MKINRVWAMPNKFTFQIKPIKELLSRYVGDGAGWIDPFAGESSPAEITNDINPLRNARFHYHAVEFCGILDAGYPGVLFDPPYSLRQVKECYNNIGIDMSFEDSKMFPTNVKNLLAPKIKSGGYVVSCGWDSTGFGKKRGFELIELLLVCHGGRHNDTIITVERKMNQTIDAWTIANEEDAPRQ